MDEVTSLTDKIDFGDCGRESGSFRRWNSSGGNAGNFQRGEQRGTNISSIRRGQCAG